MRLTKEEFCKYVNKFEEMMKEESDLLEALRANPEWKPGSWISAYYNLLINMCDLEDRNPIGNDLSYYCFELDFGRKWVPETITVDGVDIPCSNLDELWELINME